MKYVLYKVIMPGVEVLAINWTRSVKRKYIMYSLKQ